MRDVAHRHQARRPGSRPPRPGHAPGPPAPSGVVRESDDVAARHHHVDHPAIGTACVQAISCSSSGPNGGSTRTARSRHRGSCRTRPAARSGSIHGSLVTIVPDQAERPPGRSTRATSGTARIGSTQCHACPATTTSAHAVGQRDALPRPGQRRHAGRRCDSIPHPRVRLHGDHSPARRRGTRQLPGTGPEVDDPPGSASSQSTIAPGYSGRPRSYAVAASPKRRPVGSFAGIGTARAAGCRGRAPARLPEQRAPRAGCRPRTAPAYHLRRGGSTAAHPAGRRPPRSSTTKLGQRAGSAPACRRCRPACLDEADRLRPARPSRSGDLPRRSASSRAVPLGASGLASDA